MNSVLRELIEIYKPGDIDWMGFHKPSKQNFTYHHIVEKRNGGEKTLENGAILTQKSHRLLNDIDEKAHEYYDYINHEFRLLNDSKMPPSEDYYTNMARLVFEAQLVLKANLALQQEKEDENKNYEGYQRTYHEE